MRSSECPPSYLCALPGSGSTIETLANYIMAVPDAASTINSLHLDPDNRSDLIENGAALAAILTQCPNLQQLRIRVSRSALDELAAAGIVLSRLHTARLECYDPNPYSTAILLARMPNLRALSFAVLGVSLRESKASVRFACDNAILPLLEEYEQEMTSSLFAAPTHAAARTLRGLALDLFTALPDLSHLTALVYLRVQVIAHGERLLGPAFVNALAGMLHMRHLEIGYATKMENAVFAAVATLGPQLLRLGLHIVATGSSACESLARTLPRLLSGPLPSLRSLAIEMQLAEQEHWEALGRAIGGMLRARRIALELFPTEENWR